MLTLLIMMIPFYPSKVLFPLHVAHKNYTVAGYGFHFTIVTIFGICVFRIQRNKPW